MPKINFDKINEAAMANLESLLARLLPGGKREGAEYVALNPTRTDSRPGSFKVNVRTGVWSDFAVGKSGGDPVSLYSYIMDVNMGEAADALSRELAIAPEVARKKTAKKKRAADTWTPITPIPEHAPAPPEESSWREHKRYSMRWTYQDAEGRALFHICRFDKEDGEKDVKPLAWCKNERTGVEAWRWRGVDPPRPLYGLDRLANFPGLPVILVEGEKCADAGQQALTEYICVTWSGGCKSVGKSDFSPLAGRKIILWPDKDEPGLKAMIKVYESIKDSVAEVFFLHPPDDAPKGWDIADAVAEGWGDVKLTEYLRSNLHSPDDFIRLADGGGTASAPVRDQLEEAPFRCLGYNDGLYYYLPAATQQVTALAPQHHSSKNLVSLAPLYWWSSTFPTEHGASWQVAMDALMRKCEKMGIFDDRKRRGCGAWFDDKRVVLHLGDHLLVDDVSTPIHRFDTKYVYEAAPPTEITSTKPLIKKRAHLLMEAMDCLAWEKPVMGKLLAGWCVLAPISGALQWRPHVWLTGSSGTGKSWVVNNIVKPVLDSMSVYVQSNTTEAGIRQALGNNAFPVIFDEAEGEDSFAQHRLQKVIELLRQASSEGGGQIYKGSQGGKAVAYQVRSCFMLSSIGVNIQQRADASRISILSLGRHDNTCRAEFFEDLEAVVANFSREWCSGFRARAIKMIPVIRTNAKAFSRAAADYFGDQRVGDQIGALLAGAYALTSDGLITAEEAAEWIARQDWQNQDSVEMQTDEVRCLNRILQTQISVNQDGRHMVRSVAWLLAKAAGIQGDDDPPPDVEGQYEMIKERDAVLTLARHGIRYSSRTKEAVVSSYHNGLDTILKDTAWTRNYARILKRIEGATEKSTFRFEAGVITRAVGLPHDLIFGENATSG